MQANDGASFGERAQPVTKNNDDPFDLQRFVDAQSDVYARVVEELSRGRKTSHWMWFVFPQLEGLGSSALARKFAIRSLDEARAYLAHPILGARLCECVGLVNRIEGRSIEEIFGYPDDRKFHSSMTLFARAAENEALFRKALDRHFGGAADHLTLARL
jgi:uncharacterized protein (DUF1810 family)